MNRRIFLMKLIYFATDEKWHIQGQLHFVKLRGLFLEI